MSWRYYCSRDCSLEAVLGGIASGAQKVPQKKRDGKNVALMPTMWCLVPVFSQRICVTSSRPITWRESPRQVPATGSMTRCGAALERTQIGLAKRQARMGCMLGVRPQPKAPTTERTNWFSNGTSQTTAESRASGGGTTPSSLMTSNSHKVHAVDHYAVECLEIEIPEVQPLTA